MTSAPVTVSVPTIELRDAVRELAPDATVVEWDMSGPPSVHEIDIVVPPYMSDPSMLRQLREVKVRLVQSQMVGFDGVREVLPPGLMFANATSVHETSTA